MSAAVSRFCRLLATSLWLGVAGCGSSEPVLELTDYLEAGEHRIGEFPTVQTPWNDDLPLSQQAVGNLWDAILTVNEVGEVASVVITSGPHAFRQKAIQAAYALTFKPFIRSGKAVRVKFPYKIAAVQPDYVGPEDRAFPNDLDPAQVSIRLERTACFGWCPVYQVEIRGDGRVTYSGKSSVLIPGTYSWRISEDEVHQLLEMFRRADFFRLDGRYVAAFNHLPTYIVGLQVGPSKKFVLDYGGGPSWGKIVSTSGWSGSDPVNMPTIVSEIEDAIDRISGADSWVNGNAQTIERLRAARWNMQSAAGGNAVAWLVNDCNVELAKEFLASGAPAIGRNRNFGDPGTPVIADAVHCGDVELVHSLEQGGALKQKQDVEDFLLASVGSGYPEFVELALKHGGDARISDRELDLPLLVYAVSPDEPRNTAATAEFNPARIVTILLQAGADPHWISDNDGGTLLHETRDSNIAKALIAGGVPISARDAEGRTALFSSGTRDMVETLVGAGADVNAEDNQGDTPLESASNEEAALAFLSSGATLPKDPVRLQRLRAQAEKSGWTKLLSSIR